MRPIVPHGETKMKSLILKHYAPPVVTRNANVDTTGVAPLASSPSPMQYTTTIQSLYYLDEIVGGLIFV